MDYLFFLFSLITALPALVLLLIALLFVWRYRAAVARGMNQRNRAAPADSGAGCGHTEGPGIDRPRLDLRQAAAKEPSASRAAGELSCARRASARVRWIFTVAGAIQMALSACAVNWFLHRQPVELTWVQPPLLTAYLTVGWGLLVLAAFVIRGLRSRAVLLLTFLTVALGVIVLGPDHILANGPNAIRSVLEISLKNSAIPLLGLALILARSLRPFILALAAYAVFLLCGTLLFSIFFGREMANMRLQDLTLGAVGLGIANLGLSAGFLFWLLRRRKKLPPVALLAIVVVGAWAIGPWLSPKLAVGLIATGFASNVLQWYLLWLLFQSFIWLQEQHFLPGEILHFDLCWLFLALYLSQFIFIDETFTNPHLGQAAALALFLGVMPFACNTLFLHLALRREWVARRNRPGSRILLLRVFGDDAKRARLLDMLGSTWRRAGRIDLIAGTDLATRQVDARVLEAFVLGRLDTIFLASVQEVDQRVGALRDRLEGDLRYPVNELYCFADAWQHAVSRLAPESNAVIMDLRGFTRRNRGCAFELGVLVRLVPVERIFLIVDSSTDSVDLTETIQTAWQALPSNAANARLASPHLLVASFTGHIKRDADLLESCVFSVAFRAAETSIGLQTAT